MEPPLRRRHLAAPVAALAVALAGCGGPVTEEVGPVQVGVPGGWVVDDRISGDADVLEEGRWHDPDDRSRILQVLVGCGEGDADALRHAVAQAYHVHSELDATTLQVDGLDSAQRVSLALTSDPFGDASGGFLMDGLYGAGSGGLVVVELGAAEDAHDPGISDQVFASVEVDAEQLASLCAGG